MLRAAIVGCGWIGGGSKDGGDQSYTHAGAYQLARGVTLVAGCDTDPVRLRSFGERWDIRSLHAGLDGLLKEDTIDLLSVCTPDAAHAEVLRRVVEARAVRAILCEKPLATTARAAREIVEACRRAGVGLYVNYQRRWDPGHVAARRWISAGGCGAVRAVQGLYVRGLLHNGVAWINLLRMLAGEIASVRALPGEIRELEDDPTLTVWFGLENGAAAVLRGLPRKDYSVFEMDVVGSRGRVILADSGREIRYYEAREDWDFPGFRHLEGSPRGTDAGRSVGALRNLIQQAVDDLRAGRQALDSAREAVRDLEIAELARLSHQSEGAQLSVEPAADR